MSHKPENATVTPQMVYETMKEVTEYAGTEIFSDEFAKALNKRLANRDRERESKPDRTDEPVAFAIETAGGDLHDGERVLFSSSVDARDRADELNDEYPEDMYRVAPLYRSVPLVASIRAESHAQAIRQAADRIRRFRGWMAEDFEEQLIAAVLALAPAARSETPTKEPR